MDTSFFFFLIRSQIYQVLDLIEFKINLHLGQEQNLGESCHQLQFSLFLPYFIRLHTIDKHHFIWLYSDRWGNELSPTGNINICFHASFHIFQIKHFWVDICGWVYWRKVLAGWGYLQTAGMLPSRYERQKRWYNQMHIGWILLTCFTELYSCIE